MNAFIKKWIDRIRKYWSEEEIQTRRYNRQVQKLKKYAGFIRSSNREHYDKNHVKEEYRLALYYWHNKYPKARWHEHECFPCKRECVWLIEGHITEEEYERLWIFAIEWLLGDVRVKFADGNTDSETFYPKRILRRLSEKETYDNFQERLDELKDWLEFLAKHQKQ